MTNCYIFLKLCIFSVGIVLFSNVPTNTLAASPQTVSWNTALPHNSIRPSRLIAIDKNKQQLYILNGDNVSSGRLQFVCTTGQKIGNKQFQGDLKTPEGIYFIVQHLNSGLDFLLYGNEAYTLNYPNPADRYYKKTGYGIWIHGRGEAIAPLITQGCIAMDNNDLASIGNYLIPGTPVAVANSLIMQPVNMQEDSATTDLLHKKVQEWAHAWANRNPAFFSFYDEHAYSIAQQEDFSRFKAQKERLFKTLPWIKTTAKDVQVLKGPTYWITWFYQDYQAPNLTTQGIRRLYWHKNKKGEFVIMGMEWLPGLSSGSMIANAEPATPIDMSGISEEQAAPVTEPVVVAQANKVSLHSAASLEDTLPKPELAIKLYHSGKLPTGSPAPTASSPQHSESLVLAEAAKNPSTTLQKTILTDQIETKSVPSNLTIQETASVKQPPLHLPPPLPAQGLAGKSTFSTETPYQPDRKSLANPQAASATLPLPVQQPLENQDTVQTTGKKTVTLAQVDATPPVPAIITTPQELPSKQVLEQEASTEIHSATSPYDEKKPQQSLTDESSDSSTPVNYAPPNDTSAATNPATDSEAIETDTDVESNILTAIETWRQAWESGDLEFYMEFYTTNASQGKRQGISAIQKQKEQLWKQKAPKKIELSDINITHENDITYVTMQQKYTDSTGSGDIGVKTLQLELIDGLWCISDEQWSVQ